MREPVIVDVVRTTFGKRGGALANWHPVDLLAYTLSLLYHRGIVGKRLAVADYLSLGDPVHGLNPIGN